MKYCARKPLQASLLACIIKIAELQILKIVIIACIIIYSLLIFPLFLSIKIYFSGELKKIFVGLYLFNCIKIVSGYLSINFHQIAFHISEKKAIILKIDNINGVKTKVKPLMDYHIKSFKSLLEIGDEMFLFPLSIAYLYEYINTFFVRILKIKKHYIKIDNNINVFCEKKFFNAYIDSTIIFNFLMILLSIIKITVGRIVNVIKKRKQDKYRNGNRA